MDKSSSVKLALAQLNSTVGALEDNVDKIVDFARRAFLEGAQVVVTPELSLCAYPPEDLLLRPAFLAACARQLTVRAKGLAEFPGLVVVVGYPEHSSADGAPRTRSNGLDRPGVRKQKRDGNRLLHSLRRHGLWICRSEGRLQDACVPAGPLEKLTGRRSHSAKSHPASSIGRAARGPDGPRDVDPYDVVDRIIELYMEENRDVGFIVASGVDRDAVVIVTERIRLNEYKRRQAPIGVRDTHRSISRDWRYPITSGFRG